MKRFAFLFLVLSCSLAAVAQNTDKKDIKESLNESHDRIVIDLTLDNWIHDIEGDFKVEWFSRGINVYALYDWVFGNSPVSLGAGFGVSSSNIFTNSMLVHSDSTNSSFIKIQGDYRKYKIALTYLDIPVQLRFRFYPGNSDKAVKFALGFKGGILVDSHTKFKVKEGDVMKKYKEKNLEDLNRFRYGPTFRFGYGPVNLFGYYSLSGVFEKDKGPEVNAFSVGISINGL